MSKPENLKDVYADELRDLWSANDQMERCLKTISPKISDDDLKEMISKSLRSISKHTEMLKRVLAEAGGEQSKEHCKGMQGLVAEATKHTGEEAPEEGPVLDAVIIAQYQRMSHYGLAGFGTAAAYAKALGFTEANTALRAAVKDIYGGDEYLSKLAEKTVNKEANA